MNKTILLVEDDAKAAKNIVDILDGYEVEVAEKIEKAAKFLQKETPSLILLDFDLKEADGVAAFRRLHPLAPHIRTVIFSVSKSIPLAVTMAKMGAADFLSKPLNAGTLKESVKKNIFFPEEVFIALEPGAAPFLESDSPRVKFMFSEIQKALEENQDIILLAGAGIDKAKAAEVIHHHGFKRERRMVTLDLSPFQKEASEPLFWNTAQEIVGEPELASVHSAAELCGTLYLEGMENLENHFRESIFEYFHKKSGRFDKEIKIIIGISNRDLLAGAAARNYRVIEIPSLFERKEDLPRLVNFYLQRYSNKFGKSVKYLSAEVFEFLTGYDFPGNDRELQDIIALLVLNAGGEQAGIRDLPADFSFLSEGMCRRVLKSRQLNLPGARSLFEKYLKLAGAGAGG